MAEDFTGLQVNNVVVSVSLTSIDWQKETLKRALEHAGFETVHIVRDAVLAGLAYDMDELYESDDHDTYALVYSIGESSIDMGVMKVEEGMFEVLSTSEDKSINVNVLHGELVKYLRELYPELEDVPNSILDKEMERVNKVLCSKDTAQFTVIPLDAEQEVQRTITREDINHILAQYIPRIVSRLKQVTHNANLTIYDISEIIPIGDANIVLAVQTHLAHHFPSIVETGKTIPPQSVIAYGLSKVLSRFQDSIVGNYETSLQSLGIRTAGGLATPIVHRISILPAERSRVFTTVKDNQKLAVIEMHEGDRAMAEDNTILARVEVGDIPPAKRGVPRIEVTIRYMDHATGRYLWKESRLIQMQMMTVKLEGRNGEQSFTGNLPHRSYEETKTILDNIDNTVDEDQTIRAKVKARLALGHIFTEDADIVEVGNIWWDEREY
ncbi:hypothetical protein GRF29_112g184619 [Pseudopithomyces chartarum]|uniref:Uncharacterized protein n=1 Tax=Pseudopithomyces chartarum TaxID=1892770 RepID=A0AAN6RF63_9PLEO|nr:hypothetical protein GRF29_112g184619 [Pseudopithomyces chartarum]